MYVRPSRDPRRPGPFPFPSSYPAELGGMSADGPPATAPTGSACPATATSASPP